MSADGRRKRHSLSSCHGEGGGSGVRQPVGCLCLSFYPTFLGGDQPLHHHGGLRSIMRQNKYNIKINMQHRKQKQC